MNNGDHRDMKYSVYTGARQVNSHEAGRDPERIHNRQDYRWGKITNGYY